MNYLDLWEVSEVLGASAASIQKRLKTKPFTVPPVANLGRPGLLRWRRKEVDAWMMETNFAAPLASQKSDTGARPHTLPPQQPGFHGQ